MDKSPPRRRGPDKQPRKRRERPPAPPPPGPGRPPGSPDTLPRGAADGLKTLRWSVPEDTPEPAAQLADEALETIINVMRGAIVEDTQARLKAAAWIRQEICSARGGKAPHTAPGGGPTVVIEVPAFRTPSDAVREERAAREAAAPPT